MSRSDLAVQPFRLVRLRVVDNGGLILNPYGYDERFTYRWWDDGYGPDSQYFAVHDETGVEVARAELEDIEGEPWELYPTVTRVTDYTEVLFFEVAQGRRRHSVGREAVALLTQRSRRPLLAVSENADEFWCALGWEEHRSVRHDHRTVCTEPRG